MKKLLFLIFVFTVACTAELPVYLFTSFREPGTDGLYLAYSYDGYHWNDLSGPYLTPEAGESRLMRDPSVVQGPDGTYHMVWTCGWRGDNGFGYAHTKDFIHWSQQQFIPVMAHELDVVNVWAPEIFYDDDNDRFIIIWASAIPFRFPKEQEDENNNHRMYYTTTKDFKTFTATQLFLDPGFSVIDCVIVKRGKNDYVLVLKNNTRPERNISVAFATDPLGPYNNFSKPFTGFLSEGPTVLKKGNDWFIFYDNYGDKKYSAVRTSNFKTFSNISDQVSFPEGHKHGTIVKINKKILSGLLH
ncbi:glycoside hydrolase family 43 protein [Geofilum sp. OHC36d9]|uniref:glycoside hydrolase family 43 protein n=1 Tax=Geofilum sp. OHC36d9 TaxID=3458413 RepID=UPI0040345131